MTLHGTYTATIDRIEEGHAVVLVEGEDGPIDERTVPEASLPEGGTEGTVCAVTFEDGELVAIEPRPETTAERKERIREKFDRLSERLGDE